MVFTGFQLVNSSSEEMDKPVEIPDLNYLKKLHLRYDNNDFSIRYAALNFLDASRNQYMYFLEGYDDDWHRVVTSARPPIPTSSGQYTFIVKGSNNDAFGVMNPPV